MNCPTCHRALSDNEAASGKCPGCGAALPGGFVVTIDTATGQDASGPRKEPTLDLRKYAATLDTSHVPAPGPTQDAAAGADHIAATRDAATAGEMQERISKIWTTSISAQSGPRSSLKTPQAKSALESHLLAQTRVVTDPQLPATGTPDYELLSKLGEGGMGVVFVARQAAIDRTVAVKMLKPGVAEDKEARQKFLSEVAVTGDLEHPNIVPIYDLGKNQVGALFYAMKHVKGTPWSRVIRDASLQENIEILMKVADAVAFAHSRGVVHRDLKPENVMLGDFGEVLLMDWGLAVPRSAGAAGTGMGGTPAYMAPEMASGPPERIGPASDVYLLGAILYEIVTGRPPHQGKDAMDCLFAAARNEIAPAQSPSELSAIALKAMATSIADRYADVHAFQAAIREHQAHAESLALSRRAAGELAEAHKTGSYETYARALFAYQEAYNLWAGNREAEAGMAEARTAYARSAFGKGDYDLAASLLDEKAAEHRPLLRQIRHAQRERDLRQRRLRTAKWLGAALAAALFVSVTGGLLWVRSEYLRAEANFATAEEQRKLAETNFSTAEVQRKSAEAGWATAEERRKQAAAAADAEKAARQKAELAKAQEGVSRKRQEYQAYIARIGLADAKIKDNAFDVAGDLLGGFRPEPPPWEWRRLRYVCAGDVRTWKTDEPLDALAVSPDGTQVAAAGLGPSVFVFDVQSGATLRTIDTGAERVLAIAFSPDGRLLATGGNLPGHYVRLWDANSGAPAGELAGHRDAVVSIAFSRDGRRLLTSSYDETARVWDIAAGRATATLQHEWWVWSAAFSPDEKQVVTACQDGAVTVWSLDTNKAKPPFMGHHGPVYCAAFSPDGQRVASCGYDRRILLWSPADLRAVDLEAVLSEQADKAAAEAPAFEQLGAHASAVRWLSFSEDGRLLLCASHDNTLGLYDVAAREPIKMLRGHAGYVTRCAFLPGGSEAVSCSHDQSVKLWSLAGYEEARVLQGRVMRGHTDAVLAACYSPDGRYVLSSSRDRTANLWDARSGELIRTFREGHKYLTSSAAFFDGGKRLVTAAVDGTARVWQVATGTQLLVVEGTGSWAAVAASHSGRWIATGGDGKAAILWDAATGEKAHEWKELPAEVTALAFSPDDRLLVAGDAGGGCRAWETSTGKPAWQAGEHSRAVVAAVFLPAGDRVLTASRDNTVAVRDAATGHEIASQRLVHPAAVIAMALAPGGQRVLTACADRVVRLWDLSGPAVLGTFRPRGEFVVAVGFSPDGKTAVTTGLPDEQAAEEVRSAGGVRLWDLATYKEIRPGGRPLLENAPGGALWWSALLGPGGQGVLTLGGDAACLWNRTTGELTMRFAPHDSVAAAAFSPDGRKIVTGSWDNAAKIWDVESGLAERRLEGRHKRPITCVAFARDGTVLTGGEDGRCWLWDADSGAARRGLDGHTGPVRDAVFSADGRWILTASDDRTARIWNAETGTATETLSGHTQAVLCAAFSTDGRRAITGGADSVAIVWQVDPDTGKARELLRLRGHTASVNSVALSPDGRRALTGSDDRTAKLWDARDKRQILVELYNDEELAALAESGIDLDDLLGGEEMEVGQEILTLRGHSQEVTAVAFAPDGLSALTGSRDGKVIVWFAPEDAQAGYRPPGLTSSPAPR